MGHIMSNWRANPSVEVFTDRVHELNILAQAAGDLERGAPPSTDLLAEIEPPWIE
jgi:hypothetical protein